MSDRIFFDAALGMLFLFGGVLDLQRARRGFLRRQQFVTLDKNPIEAERMTPRVRRFTWYVGVFSLAVGALLIGSAVYHWLWR